MKVTVYTQAYNARKYISKCIESVLNQTHRDFEYFLFDNGSNDGSETIMKEYAQKDSRIKLIRREINDNSKPSFAEYVNTFTGNYFTSLDADDWIEPDYLETLLDVVKSTSSDIAVTGTAMHNGDDASVLNYRQTNKQLIIKKDNYADYYPYYHAFMRTFWGKLFSMPIIHKIAMTAEDIPSSYGMDTMLSFNALRIANAICIDNSVLHHYRINQKSNSHRYDPNQSFSDLYLYNDAIDFLSAYGQISDNNNAFLFTVYLNAVEDTLKNLVNADLTSEEKAQEIYEVLNREATKKALVFSKINMETICKRIEIGLAVGIKQTAEKLRGHLFGLFLKYCTVSTEIKQEYIDILKSYFVNCGKALSKDVLSLFANEPELRKLLLNGDMIGLISTLADLIHQKSLTKKYDLEGIIKQLASDDSLLLSITNNSFIRKYYDIYIYVVKKEYTTALECMTSILSGEKRVSDETFLWLYITLAALLEKTDEFLYGKLRMAEYHLCRKKYDECRAELNDLAEMGVEDNDEIKRIKKELETVGK